MDNTVTIVGNLTADPELRYTSGGAAVVRLSLASNRRWKPRDSDEWNEQVSFFDVVAWATLAENSAATLTKGDRVVVTGRLEQSTWTTAEGENRSKVQIVADEIAPSLRWATAQVERNPRSDRGSTSGQSRPAFDPSTEPF